LEETGVPVLGVLPRDDSLSTPSRHLGLVPADERIAAARATVDALSSMVSSCVDLEALLGVARLAPSMSAEPWRPFPFVGARRVVALAAGPAFTFRYAANVEMLRAGGAEVIEFDPLVDDALPAGTDAVVIGGGFPELYADRLAANLPMLRSVRAVVAEGARVYAECAGLLYLAKTLEGHEMCGVVPTDVVMTKRLSLGYRDAVGVTDAVAGLRVTGHVHHRTASTPAAGDAPLWRLDGEPAGFATDNVLASYLHLHFAGAPAVPHWLLARGVDRV
jgi:cobyrinic acid a,c-diamide synthase